MYTAHLGYCSFAPPRGTTVFKICASIAETRMQDPPPQSFLREFKFFLDSPINQDLKLEAGRKTPVDPNQVAPSVPTSTGFQVERRVGAARSCRTSTV